MSLRMLTPLDTPIFDDDVIADMAASFERHVDCMLDGCESPAEWQMITPCCQDRRFICEPHLALARARWAATLGFSVPKCGACSTHYPRFSAFDEAFEVVPL